MHHFYSVTDIDILHKLCPKIKKLDLLVTTEEEQKKLKTLSTFKELSEFNLSSTQSLNCSYLIEMINNMKENKLEKIFLDTNNKESKKEICEFYEVLFEKTNLREFSRSNCSELTPEESTLISSWLKKSFSLKTLKLQSANTLGIQHFDEIFEALGLNQSVESLKIGLELHLKHPESIKYLGNNQALKTIDFSRLFFKKEEKNALNDLLMNSKSITDLNFSFSNFEGPFDFLKKSNLKKLTFISIWKFFDPKNFIYNMKDNTSLTHLDVSLTHLFNPLNEISDVHLLIEILASHENIEEIIWNQMIYMHGSFEFQKLLKNPKLKKLNLNNSLKNSTLFFEALNENNTLKNLDISMNKKSEFEDFIIINESIETLDLHGNSKFSLISPKETKLISQRILTYSKVYWKFHLLGV
jgi:hypothetical protein